MIIGIRVLRLINTGVWLLFLASLLWIYAYLPSELTLKTAWNTADLSITKGTYFYTSLIVFVTANIFMYVVLGVLARAAKEGNGLLYFKSPREKNQLMQWLKIFQVVLSLTITFSVMYFGLANISDNYFYTIEWLLIVGPALAFLSLLYFVYISLSILLANN